MAAKCCENWTGAGAMVTRRLDIEDANSLGDYLRACGLHDAQPVVSQTLAGGVSNRTVLLARADGDWVIKQALNKLRVQTDWFADPARIHREAAGLEAAAALLPVGAAPRLTFEDSEAHVIAMTAVPSPHRNWKACLLDGDIKESHVTRFAMLAAQLHAGSAGQARYQTDFADQQYFEALRLEPYYGYAALSEPRAAGFLHALMKDTRARRLALVHGDFSPKNVLVYQDGLVLLDFEVMHYGDPAFDVGFALTHFLGKANHLPQIRTKLGDAAHAFWQQYRQGLGDVHFDELDGFAAMHLLGCLLARVAGRSPLEYLTAREQSAQREITLSLIVRPPHTVERVVEEFVTMLPRILD